MRTSKQTDRMKRGPVVPQISVTGTPFDAGRALGAAAAVDVARGIRDVLHEHHDAAWVRQRLAATERRLRRIAERWPYLTQEIEGLAAGAGQPLEYVAAWITGLFGGYIPEELECTNVAFAGGPDGPLWGGNADGCPFPLVETRDVAGQYRSVVGYGCAPNLGVWGGINEHGLALGNSGTSPGAAGGRIPAALRNKADYSIARPRRGFIPILMPIRLVLDQCRNVKEAVALLCDPEVLGHGNHVLVDADGNTATVERTGTWCHVIPGTPEGSYAGNLTRSMLDERAGQIDLATFEQAELPGWPGLWGRFAAAQRAVMDNRARHSLEFMKATLLSHAGDITRTQTICNWSTEVSYIGICRQRKLLAALAPPCLNEYAEYSVPGRGASGKG